MSNVLILAYKENEFIISAEANDELIRDKELKVGINPVLKYKADTNAVGCQLRVVYELDDRQVLSYSAIVTVVIDGWSDFLKNEPSEKEIVEYVTAAWAEVIGFVRGVICAKSMSQGNNALAQRMLPAVDMPRFLEAVALEKVE